MLPAFVLGLVMARHYQHHRQEQERLRVVAFAFLTPFFFLRGGLNVSLGAVFANLGAARGPVRGQDGAEDRAGLPARAAATCPSDAPFTTLLMSTGLTFGTISSLYGLNAGIIDRTQFSLLVTVVVLLGDRPHRDRPALVLARRRGGAPSGAQPPRRSQAASRSRRR